MTKHIIQGVAILLAGVLIVDPAFAIALKQHSLNSCTYRQAEVFATEAVVQPLLRWERKSFNPVMARSVLLWIINAANLGTLFGIPVRGGSGNSDSQSSSKRVRFVDAAQPHSPAKALTIRSYPRTLYPDGLLIPFTQEFDITHEGNTVSGDLFWMQDRYYVRLGNRWVRTHGTVNQSQPWNWSKFPLNDFLNGPLMLGNPSLQSVTGTTPSASWLDHKIPDGWEPAVEIANLIDSQYERTAIEHARRQLEATNLIEQGHQGKLTQEEFVKFLDALFILAHPAAGAGEVFIDAMDQLDQVTAIAEQVWSKQPGLSPLTPDEIQLAKQLRILVEKRRLGYDAVSLDYLALPAQSRRIKTEANDGGTIWVGDGIANRYFFGQGKWSPEIIPAHTHAENAKRWGASLEDFRSVSEIGIAGNATRIFENILGNKQTVRFIQVKDNQVDAMRHWIREKATTSPWCPEMVQIGDHWYVSLADMVYPRNPGAVVIAGVSSLEGISHSVSEPFYTQGVAHPIDPKTNQFIESLTDLAGHGDLIQTIVTLKDRLARMLREGVTWRHVQGDDLGNAETGRILSWLTRTGQTPMAATVTPQRVDFVANVLEIQNGLLNHKKITVKFPNDTAVCEVVRLDIQKGILIYRLPGGETQTYAYERERRKFERQFRGEVRPHIEKLENLLHAPPQRQQDILFDAMAAFQTGIFMKFPKIVVQIQGAEDPVDLLKIDMNEGGALFDFDGDLAFVELSQWRDNDKGTPQIPIHNSSGQTLHVYKEVLNAIYYRHFNTNNFDLDPLAVVASMDSTLKQIYHDYLNFVYAMPWGTESGKRTQAQILAARRAAEKVAAERIDAISAHDWAERAALLDLLMSTLLPPPVEKKPNKPLKINKMAQNKAGFLAHLALTDVVITDLTPAAIRASIDAIATGRVPVDSSIRKRNGLIVNTAVSSSLSPMVRAQIRAMLGVEVPKEEFTQIKRIKDVNVYTDIANGVYARQEIPGVEPFARQEDDVVRAVAAYRYAARTKLMTPERRQIFQAAMLRIQRGQNTPEDGKLLEQFRPWVYKKNWAGLYEWGYASEAEITVAGPGARAFGLKPLLKLGPMLGPFLAFILGAILEGLEAAGLAHISHGHGGVMLALAVASAIIHLFGISVQDSAGNWKALGIQNFGSLNRTQRQQFWTAYFAANAIAASSLFSFSTAAGGASLLTTLLVGVVPHLLLNLATFFKSTRFNSTGLFAGAA